MSADRFRYGELHLKRFAAAGGRYFPVGAEALHSNELAREDAAKNTTVSAFPNLERFAEVICSAPKVAERDVCRRRRRGRG